MIELLVISLVDADARRRFMEAQLGAPGLPPFRFLDAVDGRQLAREQLADSYDDCLSLHRASGSLTPTEIACAASHLGAYQHICDNGMGVAVVLEDDAVLGHQFMAVIERVLPLLDGKRPEIVLLSHVWRYSAWQSLQVDKIHRLCRPYEAYGCHGYLVNQAGAAAMLAAFPKVRTVADDWRLFMRERIVNVRAVVPYVIGTSVFANHSQISGARWSSEPPGEAARLLRKYVWRKFLFQIVIKPALRLHKQEATW